MKATRESIRRCTKLSAAALALGLSLASLGHAATGIRDLDTPAIPVKDAGKVVLIAIANAGTRLVAVGEHGVISYSDDNGQHWTQAAVPVDVTLTTVGFANAKDGWAAGHYGVILHTTDGGQTWSEQLNGIAVNALTTEAAKRAVAGNDPSPGTPKALKRAAFFSAAGPDKPFLAMWIASPQDILVFGAYRMVMKSSDGGASWTDWSLHIGDALSHNIYGVTQAGGALYLAVESGQVLKSTDAGEQFVELAAPAPATLFTVLPAGPNGVFVCGVAGNAARSNDAGQTWTPINLHTSANLTGGVVLKSGSLLVEAEDGALFVSNDNAQSFTQLSVVEPMALYGAAQAPNGDVVVVGNLGAMVVAAAQIPHNAGVN